MPSSVVFSLPMRVRFRGIDVRGGMLLKGEAVDVTFSNPRGLIAHIPPELRSQPVLNEYSMGGPLILAGIRPYIDGRADMYGDAFVQDYLKTTAGDWATFSKVVDKYGLRWTILQNNNGLIRELDRSGEWRRIYSDKVGVIHVRRGTGPAAPHPRADDAQRQNGR